MILPGAVFLSYASQDADTARRLAEALRRAGIEVWFDQDELRGGDEWDRKIRQQIRTCTLFVPLISAHTQARTEGYFRFEWHLAEQRSLLMAKGRAFIVPVCVDATPETGALVPDAFLAVQWSRPTTEAKLEQFVAQVERLLTQPLSSSRPSGASAAPRPTAAAPTALIPDYELLRQIGRGSYGDVWLARGVTGVLRAVKIVWRERFADAEPFEREFKGLTEFAAISLDENTQLALLHVGRNDEAGFFYYVMELADDAVHGRAIDPARYTPLTLSELRRRRGRIPAPAVVGFGVELARVLAGLHARGLVHRDIKPSNVILVNGGAKLADIGLVAPAASARTFVGTEGYVPPEGPGSPAADVFALGKVLYELVTGLDRQQFPQLPADLNQLPDRRELMGLNAVILRACEAQPAQRYRDAAALLADLQALQSGRRVRRFPRWPIAAACGTGLALAAGWAWLRPGPPSPPPVAAAKAGLTYVAVLPFVDLSGGKEQESLCDGLTVEILDTLARERSLRVAPRSSSFSFKGAKVAAADAARVLKVEQIVEGTVQRSGNRLRIRVQLTRAADGFTEALGNFDREVTDSFALQDEVARSVVAHITRRPLAAAAAAPTRNPEAYGLYLRARALQTSSGNLAEEVAALLSQAVDADPKFALAWARLAEARFRGFAGMTDRSPEVVNGARTALDRALDLDPNLPEALITRANWTRAVTGDFAAAQRDLDRAAALHPDTPDLRLAQSVLARDRGQWAEAVQLAQEALALDPQNGDTTNSLGVALFAPRGQFAAADELFARAMAIQGPERLFPFRNRVLLRAAWRGPEAALRLADRAPAGQIGLELVRAAQLVALGRIPEARALVEKVERAVPRDAAGSVAAFAGRQDTEITLLEAVGLNAEARRRAEEMRADATRHFQRGNRAPLVRAAFVSAEIMLGHRESALAALEEWRTETERVPGARRREAEFRQFAINLYARLGRVDEAIALLRETVADGFQPIRLMNPEVSATALRQDPRYQEIIRDARRWADRQPDPADEPTRPPEKLTAAPVAADEKSIAVLPLENLSPEPANAPFTDGLHAEIVLTLRRISDLRVTPRTDLLPLKANPKPLADVAREFRVANVLTGSVRREGQQVRISLELVRAADGSLLWANVFDRELRNSLAIHVEIADHVARLLQARGTAGLHAKQFLTKNPEVFERYLKLLDSDSSPGRQQARIKELYELVQLDPSFVPAVSTLAQAHTQESLRTRDPAGKLQHARDAKRWAEEASRLLPGPFGDVARVYYYTRIEIDNARSVALAEGVVRALPFSGEAAFYLGQALMYAGRPAEALEPLRRLPTLNPNRTNTNTVLELTALAHLRRYDEWSAAVARYKPAQTAYHRFMLTGELAPVPANPKAANADIWLLLHRRFIDLLGYDDDRLGDPNLPDADRLALLQRRFRTLQALGRDQDAAASGPLMVSLGEKLAREPALDPTANQRWLARALVCTNRVDEGLALYRRYVDGASPTNQVQERWNREKELAEVYAALGRPRDCVPLLEHLLQVPSGLTVPVLQHSPQWDGVRADPGFQALLANPRHRAPL